MKIKNNSFGKSGFDASKLTGKFGNKPVRTEGVPAFKALTQPEEYQNEPQVFNDGTPIDFSSPKLGNTLAGVSSRFDSKQHTGELKTSSQLPPKEKQVLNNYNNVLIELDNKEQQIVQYLSDKLNSESNIQSLKVFLTEVNSTLASIRNTKQQIQMSVYNLQDKLEQG